MNKWIFWLGVNNEIILLIITVMNMREMSRGLWNLPLFMPFLDWILNPILYKCVSAFLRIRFSGNGLVASKVSIKLQTLILMFKKFLSAIIFVIFINLKCFFVQCLLRSEYLTYFADQFRDMNTLIYWINSIIEETYVTQWRIL